MEKNLSIRIEKNSDQNFILILSRIERLFFDSHKGQDWVPIARTRPASSSRRIRFPIGEINFHRLSTPIVKVSLPREAGRVRGRSPRSRFSYFSDVHSIPLRLKKMGSGNNLIASLIYGMRYGFSQMIRVVGPVFALIGITLISGATYVHFVNNIPFYTPYISIRSSFMSSLPCSDPLTSLFLSPS